MKKIVVIASMAATLLMADQCIEAIKNSIDINLPKNIDVVIKDGGYESALESGWKGKLVDIQIHKKINDVDMKIGEKTDIFFCNDEQKLVSPKLTGYDGKDYRKEFVKMVLKDRRNEYRDRVISDGNNGAIFIFTDPLCPYCHRYVPKIAEGAKKKGKEIFLMSVALPMHKDSPAVEVFVEYGLDNIPASKKVDYVKDMYKYLRGKRTLKDIDIKKINAIYKKYGLKPLAYEQAQKMVKEVGEKIEKNRKIMNIVGAKGTPMVFDQNGNVVDINDYL